MSSQPMEPLVPPNTIVYQARPLPMNRAAFWVLFAAIGILFGLFVREIIDGPAGTPPVEPRFVSGVATEDPLATPTRSAEVAFMATVVEGMKSPTPQPTSTREPTTTPDPRHPPATPTMSPPPCTLTPMPGASCDVSKFPVYLKPSATPPTVLCDVVLQTPDPYHNMPGRDCFWATSTPVTNSEGGHES